MKKRSLSETPTGASNGNRTRISALGRRHNNHYTIPAAQYIIYLFPVFCQEKKGFRPYLAPGSKGIPLAFGALDFDVKARATIVATYGIM